MNGFAVIGLLALTFALAVGALIFGTNVVLWNVTDIADKGANFWNIFWLLAVGCALFGGSSKLASN